MKLSALLLLIAAPAFCAPIAVFGTASVYYSPPADFDCHVTIQSTDGYVYMNFSDYHDGATSCQSGGAATNSFGEYAAIGTLSSQYFRFAIGGGAGYLDLLDGLAGRVLASVDLVSWVTQTSSSQIGKDSTKGFTISGGAAADPTPTPEPAYSWLVLAVGAAFLVYRRK